MNITYSAFFISDTTKGNLVTPKNNKTHSFIESTPFKEDLLACSQHFDPQSDVAWDCRSPDAINFLKRGEYIYSTLLNKHTCVVFSL